MSISATANIASDAIIAETAKIWDLVQVREKAIIGENVIIGRGAYIGCGVKINDNCKVQNSALIYEPATLEQGVFVGPNVVLTNDKFPRAITPDLKLKDSKDWEPVGVYVKEGASIGAMSVCVAPLVIGKWSMIAAGSVVISNVVDFALVAGVPAKRIGWVGRVGKKLHQDDNDKSIFICPETNSRFRQLNSDSLIEL